MKAMEGIPILEWPDVDPTLIRELLLRWGGTHKWQLVILALLETRPHRFSELQLEIGDISRRMLTLSLKTLERNGHIGRTVYPVIPPRVDYELRDLGRCALDLTRIAISFSLEHRDEILRNQAEYDARHAGAHDPFI